MKNFMLMLVTIALLRCVAFGETERVDGVTWYYIVNGEEVTLGDGMGIAMIPPVTGDIVIPSRLGGKPMTRIDDRAFWGRSGVTSVTIPEGVKSIGREVIHVSNNGDIDALKRMLYESGFDVECVTFDALDAPLCKVTFDAQGGVAERTERR